MASETRVIPITQIREHELVCDACCAEAPRLYRVRVSPGVELVLCTAHLRIRQQMHPAEDVITIHDVIGIIREPEPESRKSDRPRFLHCGIPIAFELYCDLAACTLGIVSRACDAVENRPEFSKLTIIPPVEGTTEFNVFVNEDKTAVDLPALKKALVETLEAMV